jgi:nickel/cobalt exporter
MPDIAQLLQQGGAHAWLYFPSAILLGALHGLEPGHSKTMMAAFIVAVRGTVKQSILLGLAATLSHTAVVWLVAIGGMYLGSGLDAKASEPYFQLASAAVIIAIAVWMLWRTWQGERGAAQAKAARPTDMLVLQPVVAGQGAFSVLQRPVSRHQHGHVEHGGHAGHDHDHGHGHDHAHAHAHSHDHGLDIGSDDYQDAHERAHADDIRKRFTDREVTTGQIIMFGLTGGLIPCPAAITVLLLCLQVKQVALGGLLVLCFSLGLALTLVTVGVAAALGARHAASRLPWLSKAARRAPYLSGLLIIGVGIYVAAHAWLSLV